MKIGFYVGVLFGLGIILLSVYLFSEGFGLDMVELLSNNLWFVAMFLLSGGIGGECFLDFGD